MNKTAIKNFSTYSRRKLIESTKDKCKTIGITEESIESPVSSSDDFEIYNCYSVETTLNKDQIKQRNSLIKEINDKGFNQVVEEVAYTWFNRLIAVRFMEVNDYLPSRQRVLSSIEDARIESDLMRSPNESDIDFTSDELNYVYNLKEQNNTNELFKFLFIKECNKLNEYLPELFEKTDDYTELLFNISFDDKDDVVYKLVHDIEESNFDIEQEGQVEIIGWFYQYYNSELKDETMAKIKKTKSTKNDIPAITQLFTPDWIVKYMVENSLGRLWYEGHPSDIKDSWRYYVDEAEQEESVQQQLNEIRHEYSKLNIEDIKLIDPCMGSGHILVYAFDVFMQIYLEQGYSERNAAKAILENNIYGLDIDKRAYQLSYFALMMKARQYNRRIFNSSLNLHLCEIKESPKVSLMDIFDRCGEQKDLALRLYSSFIDAKEYGSIIEPNVTIEELNQLEIILNNIKNNLYENIVDATENDELVETLKLLIFQARVLVTKYEVVVTNPPYMAPTPIQKKYVEKKYPNSKSDLFAIMMERCSELLNKNGYQAMITMQSWMFLSSFEKLRTNILNSSTIINMLHLGARAFDEIGGEVVQATSFIQTNLIINNYHSTYFRLLDGKSELEKETMFLNKENKFDKVSSNNFLKISSSPFAYWLTERYYFIFDNYTLLDEYGDCNNGFTTGNNDLFLRIWYEVKNNSISFNTININDTLIKTWYPYNKGGSFRKWYGNNDYVINWFNNGYSIKKYGHLVPRAMKYQFNESISWSKISSGKCSFRYKEFGTMFDVAGLSLFVYDDKNLYYLLALLNSKITNELLKALSPTLNFETGQISSLPIIISNEKTITSISLENKLICKYDWDSFETSWDFTIHPLVKNHTSTIKESYDLWNQECDDRFNQLKSNEEELNRIFIDIYGLQDELTPEVDDKDITVRKANLTRDIKSFISYAIGCMFGRYSLNEEGLIYAGGTFDINRYQTFKADKDNILPICDEEYFDDDIVGRFIDFVRTVYGQDTLEENLNFIADALNTNGSTSREKIRNYFIKDFFKDHCQTYSVTGSGKRPIYWLFDSGKQNGFKALIYMHRYEEDTVGRVRTDYLHKVQSAYEDAIKNDEYIIENSNIKSDINKASKHRDKLLKQLEETRIYDQALAHMANKRISIDLDDGVKHNYALFQGIEVSKEGSKTRKVDLLAKIK